MGAPALTLAGPVLPMARSARGLMIVLAVAALLALSLHDALPISVAVLVTVPDTGAVPVTVMTWLAPLVRSAKAQVRTPEATEEQTAEVEGDVKLVGSVSVTEGAAAVDGPLLVTVKV